METPTTVSDLLPQIQNELIYPLASTVRNQLISNIKLLFHSTSDIAHQEQMSQVFRYVDIDFTNRVSIKESDASSTKNTILEKRDSINKL